MDLSRLLWTELLNLWPCEFEGTFYVNLSSNIYVDDDHKRNIFSNTEWIQLNLEIRGNSLFAYDVDEYGMGFKKCGPVMAWILEHAFMELRNATDTLTLPDAANAYGFSASKILYIRANKDEAKAAFAIFSPTKQIGENFYYLLKRCSLTYMKSILDDHDTDARLLSDSGFDGEADIAKQENEHRLEFLAYEHEFLQHQRDALRLDNTLLLTQYSVNKQAFSEHAEQQLKENENLKDELEVALEKIKMQELDIIALKSELTILKEERNEYYRLKNEMKSAIESFNATLNAANIMPEKKLRVMYTQKSEQVDRLALQLTATNFERAKITNRYHNLKKDMISELNKINEIVQSNDIYEMLKLWISCNELKVEYYETSHELPPEKQEELLRRIQAAQQEFKISITLARAAYISYRTSIFDEIIKSLDCRKSTAIRGSQLVINSAFERLSWVFQPSPTTPDDLDASESLWMNRPNIDRLIENILYENNSDNAWYTKVSFASALNPVLTNAIQYNSQLLQAKQQLHECICQNEQLRKQIKLLSKQIGNDLHWKMVWKKAHFRLKSKVPA